MNENIKNILEWVECIVIAVVLAVIIRYFIGTPTIVKQESMYPTLKPNERLILNRISRITKKMPKRGEIITFEAPSDSNIEEYEYDENNPIAKYENEPKSILGKFSYYVLEWGKTSYIKRVIALPGEHVRIYGGKIYINNEELDEPYLPEGVVTDSLNGLFTDLIVPENCIFALGDNRGKSTDCRRFGCIPIEKVEGIVTIRFFPLDKFGKIDK